MHILDWFLLALIALAAGLAVWKIIRDRRAGKCCGDCSACAARCAQKPGGQSKYSQIT